MSKFHGKTAMEILSGNNPTVAALCNKVAETENRLWNNAGRNLGKFTGGQAPLTGTRFCKPCNSSTHWESQCWGICKKSSQTGHRTEWCHTVPQPDPEQAKAAGEKIKKLTHDNDFICSLGSKMSTCCGPAVFLAV